MAIGFSLNVTIMILVLAMSIASIGWVFQNELVGWVERTTNLFLAPSSSGAVSEIGSQETSRGG